jgi:putative transposase
MGDPIQTNASPPHSNALRVHRVTLPNRIYHVTKRLSTELAVLVDLTQADFGKVIVNSLIHQRDKAGCRLFAFVVMPDHVHWLFALPEGGNLSDRVKVVFNWCALQLNKGIGRGGRVWQDGYLFVNSLDRDWLHHSRFE